jgi:hypothetical protein
MTVKITNSETIKSSERELIDAITGDLDWSMIEDLVRERHKLTIQDDVEYRDGDIIVHDSQVAYRLDFEVKMNLSVIFDRNGNFLSLKTSEAEEAPAVSSPAHDDTKDEESATGDEQRLTAAANAPRSENDDNYMVKLESELADMSNETTDETADEASSGDTTDGDQTSAPVMDAAQEVRLAEAPNERMASMATRIADMISEINEDTIGS